MPNEPGVQSRWRRLRNCPPIRTAEDPIANTSARSDAERTRRPKPVASSQKLPPNPHPARQAAKRCCTRRQGHGAAALAGSAAEHAELLEAASQTSREALLHSQARSRRSGASRQRRGARRVARGVRQRRCQRFQRGRGRAPRRHRRSWRYRRKRWGLEGPAATVSTVPARARTGTPAAPAELAVPAEKVGTRRRCRAQR